jgi:hypothetical protein
MLQCNISLRRCDISVLKDAGIVRSLVVNYANIWAFRECQERQEQVNGPVKSREN